jgi:hypothetical protein
MSYCILIAKNSYNPAFILHDTYRKFTSAICFQQIYNLTFMRTLKYGIYGTHTVIMIGLFWFNTLYHSELKETAVNEQWI